MPPSASSKRPDPALQRAGEGALLVAEQLALDQPLRDRPAVDLDQRPVPARAPLVQRAGDQLLAGAGLAGEQHGGLHRGHLLHLPQHRPERGALAHDPFEPALLGDRLLEIGVLQREPVAIALDFAVELRISDRERRLVGEDAQKGELLGRDPAAGEKADRAELLALELERKSGRTTDPHRLATPATCSSRPRTARTDATRRSGRDRAGAIGSRAAARNCRGTRWGIPSSSVRPALATQCRARSYGARDRRRRFPWNGTPGIRRRSERGRCARLWHRPARPGLRRSTAARSRGSRRWRRGG